MKHALTSLALLLATTTIGCGMLVPAAGSPANSPEERSSKHVVRKETHDALRKGFTQAYAHAAEADEERLDKAEKDALKALEVTLGKRGTFQGAAPPESSSTALTGLRAAKIKVRLEIVTDEDGKAVNDDFLQLKDSFTDRVQVLSRKITEQKASKAEIKEVQEGAKHVAKLNDLRQQVSQISLATMTANSHVQTANLQQMLRVSQLVRSHRLYEMDWNDEDFALVKKGLASQKRAEAIAGATMGMMAAYQAVIGGSGDPKALDVIAAGTLKAFPIKVEVTDQEAKDYVAALGVNVAKVKGQYEAMMRKAHGDKKYERTYKAGIDRMFAQAEGAGDQKSASQMADDRASQFKQDVASCKTSIDPAAESRLGPSCKTVFRAAQTGDTSELLPGVKKAFDETGGVPAGANSAKTALGDRERTALAGATSALKGDVDGTLDAAVKLVGEDSTVGASLQGIAALKRGDARGAIAAAVKLIPVPGLKEVFGLASKLFG